MSMQYFDLSFRIFLYVIAGLLGGVFGSFMDCMAYRLMHGLDWKKGRSRCDSCGHVLGVLDLIPVFSWLFHKGKCRYCGAEIPKDCLYTEAGMALAFILLLHRYGISADTLRYWLLTAYLLGLSLIDMKTYEIPDGFHIAGIITWLATLPLLQDPLYELKQGLLGAVIIGGGILLVSLIFDKVSGKEGLGGGDVKLLAVLGLYFGASLSLFNLICACVIGLVFVLVLKQNKIPFGPSISIAAFVTMLAGEGIVGWYLSLF